MKTNLKVILIALAVVVLQSCGSKTDKDSVNANEETASQEATEGSSADIEVRRTEERARLQKNIEEWEAKRAVAVAELARITPTYTDASGKVVYNKAEVEPVFGKGRNEMMNYLNNNLVYPEAAKEKGLEGTIFVDFIVAADGTVREAVVTEATSDEVDQLFRTEALRVVTAMPKWTPGLQRGKPVDVKFSLPITFQLD